MALKPKIKNIICPLGVSAHLEYWGFSPSIIHEGDWSSKIELPDNWQFHILPSRHFSGRLTEKNQTLWSSFCYQFPQIRKSFTVVMVAMAIILNASVKCLTALTLP